MPYDSIVVAISEIWIKSEYVRRTLINTLVRNIKKSIGSANFQIRRGRIIIRPYNPKFLTKLKKIFGIRFFAPAITVKTSYNDIKEALFGLLRGKSCRVYINVRRVWKGFEWTSVEMGKMLAKDIIKEGIGIEPDLENYDLEVFIEIHKDVTYIYTEKIECYDGFPVGCCGRALIHLSDMLSIIPAWLMAKRGVLTDFFYLSFTSSFSIPNSVLEFFNVIREWISQTKLYYVSIAANRMLENELATTFSRKLIAQLIAQHIAKEGGYDAVLTNDITISTSSEVFSFLSNYVDSPVLLINPISSFVPEDLEGYLKIIGLPDDRIQQYLNTLDLEYEHNEIQNTIKRLERIINKKKFWELIKDMNIVILDNSHTF